jgi:hypothetical protein
MIGARVAQARWYPVHASDAERLESCLRRLASIVGQAMKENEPDRAIRALAVMVPFERMRIALPAQNRQRGPSRSVGLQDFNCCRPSATHTTPMIRLLS